MMDIDIDIEQVIAHIDDDLLIQELRNRDYALSIWSYEDVLHRAKERDILCDEIIARQVCNAMDRKHDATLGITWDTIDYWIDEFRKL